MTEQRKRIPDELELATAHSGFATHVGPYHCTQIAEDDGEPGYWLGLKVDERHAGRHGGKFGHGGILLTCSTKSWAAPLRKRPAKAA